MFVFVYLFFLLFSAKIFIANFSCKEINDSVLFVVNSPRGFRFPYYIQKSGSCVHISYGIMYIKRKYANGCMRMQHTHTAICIFSFDIHNSIWNLSEYVVIGRLVSFKILTRFTNIGFLNIQCKCVEVW